jgi:hypothetical protein
MSSCGISSLICRDLAEAERYAKVVLANNANSSGMLCFTVCVDASSQIQHLSPSRTFSEPYTLLANIYNIQGKVDLAKECTYLAAINGRRKSFLWREVLIACDDDSSHASSFRVLEACNEILVDNPDDLLVRRRRAGIILGMGNEIPHVQMYEKKAMEDMMFIVESFPCDLKCVLMLVPMLVKNSELKTGIEILRKCVEGTCFVVGSCVVCRFHRFNIPCIHVMINTFI